MGYYCLNCKKKVEDEEVTHCPECGHKLTLVSPVTEDEDEIPEVEGMKSKTRSEKESKGKREDRGKRDTVKLRDDGGRTKDPDDFGLPDDYAPIESEMPEDEDRTVLVKEEEEDKDEEKDGPDENLMDVVLEKVIKVKDKLEEED